MRVSTWRPRDLGIAALCVAMAGSSALAQGAGPGDPAGAATVVRGTAFDALTGTPLRGVSVAATAGGKRAGSATSAADGTFLLFVEDPKDLRVAAGKAGYANAVVDVAVSTEPGVVTRLRVAMTPGGAISGRIIERGGSAAGAIGLPTLHRVGADGSLTAATPATVTTSPLDPERRYRFGGLPAGRYRVGVEIRSPTTVEPPSRIIEISPGADISGVDLVADVSQPAAPTADKPVGFGVVRGRVWANSGEPLAAATVVLSRRAGGVWSSTTDASGRFAVDRLPASTFLLIATKRGYVPTRAPDGNPGAPSITLAPGEHADDVELWLAPTASISGGVMDEHGDPVQNARVRVTPADVSGNQLVSAADPLAFTTTDDRGVFRLAGLPPGVYVAAAFAPDASEGYAPVYFPDSRERALATPITLVSGADVTGISMTLRPVTVSRVSGVVVTAAGLPAVGAVRLLAADDRGEAFEPRTASVGPNGEFAFTGVPGGTYLVEMRTNGPAGPELATEHVTVTNIDHPPVTLRTRPGARMTGRLVLEGAAAGWIQGYSMAARRLAGGVERPETSHLFSGPIANGTAFTMTDLWGPTRVQFSSPDETYYLESIRIGGVEAADEPFDFGVEGRLVEDVEVTFSAAAASVLGRAIDERGLGAGSAFVVVFPLDPARWFIGSRWIKSATANRDGTFAVRGMPPGDYYAVAVERRDGGAIRVTPQLLQELAIEAIRITAAAGAAPPVTLRLKR